MILVQMYKLVILLKQIGEKMKLKKACLFIIISVLISGCSSKNELIISGPGNYKSPLSSILLDGESFTSILITFGEEQSLAEAISAATEHAQKQRETLNWQTHNFRLLSQDATQTGEKYECEQLYIIYTTD